MAMDEGWKNNCPICTSFNVDTYGEPDFDEWPHIEVQMLCNTCKSSWLNIFTMTEKRVVEDSGGVEAKCPILGVTYDIPPQVKPMANPVTLDERGWQLYSDMPGSLYVADFLNKQLNLYLASALDGTAIYSKMRDFMFLDALAAHGTADTEPRYVLRDIMRKRGYHIDD